MVKNDVPTLAPVVEELEVEPLPEDGPVVKVEQIPLWTEKWPKEALLEKRQVMGAREFDRGFRQRAISDEDLLFKPEWIDRALDRNMVLPDSASPGTFWAKFPRDAGVDLAIASAEKEAAFFAIVGIATTNDWHRWVMNVEFTRGLTFGQQTFLMSQCQDRFQYEIVTVENNGFQDSILRHYQEEGTIVGTRVPVRAFRTGAVQKKDLAIGVPSMGIEFEQARWHIPYGDARSRRIVEPLIEEMRQYPEPGFHDDAIMAMFFARESRRLGAFSRPMIRVLKW